MAIITKPKTFAAGTTAVAADVNSDFDTIYNDYNGNITDANININANINSAKLASITAGGKVSGTALTGLASIPAAAGEIPVANLPVGTAANEIVQMTAAAKLPAVDGSLLTAVAAATVAAPLGAWDDNDFVGAAWELDKVYQAPTDGFIDIEIGGNEGAKMQVLSDASNPPTTVRFYEWFDQQGGTDARMTAICPIKKGHYFKAVSYAGSGTLERMVWIPLGT